VQRINAVANFSGPAHAGRGLLGTAAGAAGRRIQSDGPAARSAWSKPTPVPVETLAPISLARPRQSLARGGSGGGQAPAPTSVNIALPHGPTNHIQLDAPDQGARGGVDRVVGLGPL
jgi:hypothetical protein